MANIEFFGVDVPLEFPGQTTPNTDWVPNGNWSKWDLFYVAGKPLPGKAMVSGKKSHRVDKKYAPGQDGATLTHLGNNLGEVEVKLVFWLKWQWDTLQRMMGSLFPLNNKASPTPFDCSHPDLDFARIKSLYLLEIGLPKVHKAPDIYEIDFKWSEFSPAKKKNVANTPNASLDLSQIQTAVPASVPASSDPTTPPSQTNSDATPVPNFTPYH